MHHDFYQNPISYIFITKLILLLLSKFFYFFFIRIQGSERFKSECFLPLRRHIRKSCHIPLEIFSLLDKRWRSTSSKLAPTEFPIESLLGMLYSKMAGWSWFSEISPRLIRVDNDLLIQVIWSVGITKRSGHCLMVTYLNMIALNTKTFIKHLEGILTDRLTGKS